MKKIMGLHKSLALLAPLGLAACNDDADTRPTTEVQTIGLDAFESCDALLGYFQEEALTQVQFFGWAEPAFAGGRATDDAAGAPEAGGEGQAPEFSGTNVQEAGVDELDFVKTDGRFLYVARSRSVLIYDTDLTLLSEIELGGWAQSLLLEGDRLVVLTAPDELAVRPEGVPERYGRMGRTRFEIYDVADRAQPALLRSTEVEGGLVAARLTGGAVRAVVHFDGAWGIQWDLPGGGGGGISGGGSGGAEPGEPTEPVEPQPEPVPVPDEGMQARRDAQEVDYEAAWRAAVEGTTLADWVPYRIDLIGENQTAGPIAACTGFHRPGERGGHGVTAVVSIDLDRLDVIASDPAVVTAPGVVYASQDSLYIATINHAGWLVGGGDVAVAAPDVIEGGATTEGIESRASAQVAEAERQATQIHKLSIEDGAAPATYQGSGRVFGTPLNQFSLSEHAQHLRIGTTEDTPEGPTNHLFVLGAGGETGLQVTGQVNDLAASERIYAMRFLGERGFMVTFRQVDPLFTFDLSDPTNPRQVGELKIPGFSTYLHPFGAEHLIGLGQAATEEGQVTGMQLSLFDVSDLALPTQAHTFDLGSGWSEALYDHHAFTFWAPESIALLPVDRWDGEAQHAGLDIIRVDAATGFAADGFVSHESLGFGRIAVRRSIVIGDTLVTLSEAGILINDLDTLQEQHAVPFPDANGPRPCDGGAEIDCG